MRFSALLPLHQQCQQHIPKPTCPSCCYCKNWLWSPQCGQWARATHVGRGNIWFKLNYLPYGMFEAHKHDVGRTDGSKWTAQLQCATPFGWSNGNLLQVWLTRPFEGPSTTFEVQLTASHSPSNPSASSHPHACTFSSLL